VERKGKIPRHNVAWHNPTQPYQEKSNGKGNENDNLAKGRGPGSYGHLGDPVHKSWLAANGEGTQTTFLRKTEVNRKAKRNDGKCGRRIKKTT